MLLEDGAIQLTDGFPSTIVAAGLAPGALVPRHFIELYRCCGTNAGGRAPQGPASGRRLLNDPTGDGPGREPLPSS